MRSINRRSFLAGTAGAASAIGVGAAFAGSTGAGVAGAQTLPAGSSGIIPIENPGLVGLQTPGGVVDQLDKIRFALPSGLTDWIDVPAPHGARDDQKGVGATGGIPTPDGATGFEVKSGQGNQPVYAATGVGPTGSSAVDDFVRSNGEMNRNELVNYAGLPTTDLLGFPVVPRWAWGADESITSWGPEFREAQVLTVHHSVTPAGWDTAATMRGFHRYHTLSNGWGDIGYQLVIDPAGVVYQGRVSGLVPVFSAPPIPGIRPQSVTGAHVGGNNSGNIGVCLMGDFDNAMPSGAQWSSLVNVLARLSAALMIDPIGGVHYNNPDAGTAFNMRSINGHRDWMSTGCPGNMMAGAMDVLRGQVAGARASLGIFPGSSMPTIPQMPQFELPDLSQFMPQLPDLGQIPTGS